MEATAPYNSKKQNNNTNVSLSRLLVAIIITVCVCSLANNTGSVYVDITESGTNPWLVPNTDFDISWEENKQPGQPDKPVLC